MRRGFSSWAPAANPGVGGEGVEIENPQPGSGSSPQPSPSPSPSSSAAATAAVPNPLQKPPGLTPDEDIPSSAIGTRQWWGTKNPTRCRHLEECMFPRYLSLDCKQFDDLCMGRVEGQSSAENFLGRIYVEALHLKEFLKSRDDIIRDNASLKKRKRKNCDPPKKRGRASPSKEWCGEESDALIDDTSDASRMYFGGLEGKRTWLLANSSTTGKYGGMAGSYCQSLPPSTSISTRASEDPNGDNASSSDTALSKFESRIASEIRLTSWSKRMRLHDHTSAVEFLETSPEFMRLEDLVKPLDGYTPPKVEEAKSQSNSSTEIGPAGVNALRIDGKRNENGYRMSIDATTSIPVAPNTPSSSMSGKDTSPEKESPSLNFAKMAGVVTTSSTEHDAMIDNTRNKSRSMQSGSNFDRTVREGKDFSLAANMMFVLFRKNRRKFWAHKLMNGKAPTCAWCPPCSTLEPTNSSSFQFGAIRDGNSSEPNDQKASKSCQATGDDLIQCLECGLVGCAPALIDGKEKCDRHIMLHFLFSGHKFGESYDDDISLKFPTFPHIDERIVDVDQGATCGPLGEIFCFSCGDIIHHECFEQERERILLEKNIPALSWRETPILRGVDPFSFLMTPETGIVWRGMIATYPTPVSAHFGKAARFAANRSSIFNGHTSFGMGTKATELSHYQQTHYELAPWISTPVGFYNIGNSCYVNAVLQCMVHCKPLQKLFLRDLAHPYQSCNSLRNSTENKNTHSCLVCELDIVFLEYYGSAVGIDAVAAVEEQPGISDDNAKPAHPDAKISVTRGHPIIPLNLIAEVWKEKGMKILAGHGQNDAQEFFNGFVQCLTTHAINYQIATKESRQMMHEPQIQHCCNNQDTAAESNTDFISDIFTGVLRSVLICQKCGCKRTQTQTFSNVSLPLANDSPSVKTEARSRRRNHSVRSILDQFTRPETLADHVQCPSCNIKTKTIQQHTFSKLPKVLCLHLKRFNAAANKKITDFVSFPAKGLDMGKYLPHWCERGLAKDKQKDTNTTKSKVMYDLFGTVNHEGSLNQGHYIANVKCGNTWYSCNDAFISLAGKGDGEAEVMSSAGAYMIFYIRR